MQVQNRAVKSVVDCKVSKFAVYTNQSISRGEFLNLAIRLTDNNGYDYVNRFESLYNAPQDLILTTMNSKFFIECITNKQRFCVIQGLCKRETAITVKLLLGYIKAAGVLVD